MTCIALTNMPLTEPERLRLANLPTPIEQISSIRSGWTVSVKRDDLTGAALSGNKVRKLEYLLADAMARGARRVVTCGGLQSNHCRATAVAAAQVGLASLLFLRTRMPPRPDDTPTGNLKLARLVGAEVRFVTPDEYVNRRALMADEAGPQDYVIPEGGSNALGAWGYIRAIDEMIDHWKTPPSAIVCATGSGGTLAGLTIGACRRGLAVPVHGIAVCNDASYFQQVVEQISTEVTDRWPSLPRIHRDVVSVIEGYKGQGYALSSTEEDDDITLVARASGLILDPVYTGKAFRALLHEPDRFGLSPLFIHTGGIFGLLA
jgi:D-cysteine desulfhydrase